MKESIDRKALKEAGYTNSVIENCIKGQILYDVIRNDEEAKEYIDLLEEFDIVNVDGVEYIVVVQR